VSPDATPVRNADIWTAFLDPTVGHEQGGRRPVIIVSSDELHIIPSQLVFVVPVTTKDRGVESHVRVSLREGALPRESFAMTEQIRSVSTQRLRRRVGTADDRTLSEIQLRLRLFLDFPLDVAL